MPGVEMEFLLAGLFECQELSSQPDSATRGAYSESVASHSHSTPKRFGLKKGFLVCNSNCAVIGIVIPFAALQAKFGPVEDVEVFTEQAVSGAGYSEVPSMDIIDNVIPYISGEEDKLETEAQKFWVQSITTLRPLRSNQILRLGLHAQE